MATHNQDIKTLFELYDCQPNQRRFEKFLNSLLATGGRCDIDGWSLADCLQRLDDGAVTALGAAAPNAGGLIAANGGGAPMEKRRGLRRARLKMSFSHLILHLDHPEVKAILSKAPFLGNGPVALDYLRQRCSTPGNTGEQQDKQMEWCSLTIKGHIGIDENTLINLDLRLTSINQEMLPEYAYSGVVQSEKILREIASASQVFMVEATRELNAVEGVPGQPNVRLFQGPEPVDAQGAVTGDPRPRDKVALLAYFHALYADMSEPNFYTHEQLPVIAAVFADDVGAGYAGEAKAEYLALRNAYGELINIDSPGPDTVCPISLFVGCEIGRDRQARTLKVTQQGYIQKLRERFEGEFTLNDLPYGASKAKREARLAAVNAVVVVPQLGSLAERAEILGVTLHAGSAKAYL